MGRSLAARPCRENRNSRAPSTFMSGILSVIFSLILLLLFLFIALRIKSAQMWQQCQRKHTYMYQDSTLTYIDNFMSSSFELDLRTAAKPKSYFTTAINRYVYAYYKTILYKSLELTLAKLTQPIFSSLK